ncbi:MAG: hypothetical protein AB1491_02105 [Thermodesulfobacteriota bacterium]
MANSGVKQEIIKQLDRLPLELQYRVLNFAQELALSRPKGVPGKQLLPFAGILRADEAAALTQAIEEGCERIDINEW